MNEKRDAYVHTRVTERELRLIDALVINSAARGKTHLRRSRSDTMRVLALEKAEELRLVPRPPRPKTTDKKKGEEKPWDIREMI